MRTIVLVVIFINLNLPSFSQYSDFGVQIGLGSFIMAEFKSLNEMVQSSLPFETKVTNNFPMNIVYKIYSHVTYNNNIGLGLKYSFSSSGSIISREDYSGSYYFKNQVNFQSPGIIIDYSFITSSKVKIIVYNELGWEFSRSKMHENLTLNPLVQEDINKYRSVNIFTEPGFRVVYPYNDKINLGFFAACLIDSNSQIKESTTTFKVEELYDFSHGDYSLNWSGLRLGLSVSFTIPQ